MVIIAATGAAHWQVLLPTTPLPNSSSTRRRRNFPSSVSLPTTNCPLFRPNCNLSCSSSSRSRNKRITTPVLKSNSTFDFFEPLSLSSPVSAAAVASSAFLSPHSGGLGGGGGGVGGGGDQGGSGDRGDGGRGGGGGGGGGKGFFCSWFLCCLRVFSAEAKENEKRDWDSHGLPADMVVQLERLSGTKRYKVSGISFYDLRSKSTSGPEDTFFDDIVQCRPGGVYTKAVFQSELELLRECGLFKKVGLEAKTNADGSISLTISYADNIWNSQAQSFRCINVGMLPRPSAKEVDPDMTFKEKAEQYKKERIECRSRVERAGPCLLPAAVEKEVTGMLMESGVMSARLLQKVMERVQRWYTDEGYHCATALNSWMPNSREVVCEVAEGEITAVDVQFLDKLGNKSKGNTNVAVIHRALSPQLRPGHVFHIEAARRALRSLNELGLFSNAEMKMRGDDDNIESGIVLEIIVRELDKMAHSEVSTEWSLVPGNDGWPSLANIQPGGTISFEHRNIGGLNRSINGSITTANFFNPEGGLEYNFEYVHPYLDGVDDPRERTLRASCFNVRKLSPVFAGGLGMEELPCMWVDRAGLKATSFTRQSKLTYGLVLEKIVNCDDDGVARGRGFRLLPRGDLVGGGPPTTLSGTGVDAVAFLQANLTRDNTRFVNGGIVGERNIFQVDQGLGIGTNSPMFNRHQLTMTRFLQLKEVAEGDGRPPPPVLVLHGRYGGCVGDLPSYDAFVLGGPYSVRGYDTGELGACRNILEVAAELRVPVRKNTYVHAFVEHGDDLGSSVNVKGNLTKTYHRAGRGSSYGVGVMLGQMRMEYTVDHNSGTGAIFFRYGERF